MSSIKWNYEPHTGRDKRCLVAFKAKTVKERIIVDNGWTGMGRIAFDGFAWAEYPADITVDRTSWKSIYNGDEEPIPGMYILCIHKYGRAYKRIYQFYDPDKSQFEPGVEVVGWCELRPYPSISIK